MNLLFSIQITYPLPPDTFIIYKDRLFVKCAVWDRITLHNKGIKRYGVKQGRTIISTLFN